MYKILWTLNWNMIVVYVDNPHHIGEDGWKMKASPRKQNVSKEKKKNPQWGNKLKRVCFMVSDEKQKSKLIN